MLVKKLPTFSASQYSMAFLLAMVLVVVVQGGFILGELRNIQSRANQQVAQQAKADFYAGMSQAQTRLANNTRTLSNWDESRQMLVNPTYYAYWRASRVLSSGLFDKAVVSVSLYTEKGHNLNPMLDRTDSMPPTVATEPALYIISQHGRPYAIQVTPIYDGTAANRIVGWGALQTDLVKLISDKHLFKLIDPQSIRTDLSGMQQVNWSMLLTHIQYKTPDNPEFRELSSLMERGILQISLIVLAFLFLGFFLLQLLIIRPITSLSRHILALPSGKSSAEAQPSMLIKLRELETIRSALHEHQHRVAALNETLEQKNAKLWELAHLDSLTGAFNRRAFDEDMQKIQSGELMCFTLTMLLIDCDHFKPINDTYGHEVGDSVIRGIAESLKRALRSQDKLYRLGGDEFCTLLFDLDIMAAQQIAERCQQEVALYDFDRFGVREPVIVSIGLAYTLTDDINAMTELAKQADIAMYQAKRPGSHKIVAFNAEQQEISTAILSNPEVSALFEAIKTGKGIVLHFQPIVSLPNRETDYFEVLTRISTGDQLLTPNRIFPIIEMRRLEIEFDLAIINAVSEALAAKTLPPGTGVSINVSGPSLINQQVVAKLLQLKSWLKSYKIVIELTETAFISQMERATSHLRELRRAGFLIALDDFGSGYSSLRYLADMPVDIVKFDLSLIQCLIEESRQQQLVQNLVHLIQSADYAMVAEGIENETLLEKVMGLGFTHAQGFYLGLPETTPELHLDLPPDTAI